MIFRAFWPSLGALALCCAIAAAATTPAAKTQAPAASKPATETFLSDTTVMARIDKKVVRADEFNRLYFDVLPEFRPAADSSGRVEFLNTVIDKEVMGNVARNVGYQLTFEERLAIRQHTDRLLSNMLFQRYVLDTIKVSEDQVRRVFEQYSRDLHLRQITFGTPEDAEQTRRDLVAKKVTWAKAAQTHRVPPDARDAEGDIGWIDREKFDPMLGLDLFDLKPGQISAVVPDAGGYHVFYVVEERPGQHVGYQVASRLIRDQLYDRSRALGSQQLRSMVAKGLDLKIDSANVVFAAMQFKPARAVTEEAGVPNLDFDPNVPAFTAEDTARVLIRYRDGRITIGDYLHYYSEIPSMMRPNVNSPTLLANQVEGLVLEPYMAKAALERGLDKDSITVASVQKRTDQILVDRLYADSISSKVHISKSARRKYYDAHSERYITWPSVRFAAVAFKGRAGADSLAKRLRAGEKAADFLLADSLAGIRRGTIQERREDEGGPYQKALFEELKPGGVSVEGPDAEGSYLVLQLLAYNRGQQLSFDDADRYVTESLTNIEEEKVLKAFLARHRRKFKIESHPELVMKIRMRHPAAELDRAGRVD